MELNSGESLAVKLLLSTGSAQAVLYVLLAEAGGYNKYLNNLTFDRLARLLELVGVRNGEDFLTAAQTRNRIKELERVKAVSIRQTGARGIFDLVVRNSKFAADLAPNFQLVKKESTQTSPFFLIKNDQTNSKICNQTQKKLENESKNGKKDNILVILNKEINKEIKNFSIENLETIEGSTTIEHSTTSEDSTETKDLSLLEHSTAIEDTTTSEDSTETKDSALLEQSTAIEDSTTIKGSIPVQKKTTRKKSRAMEETTANSLPSAEEIRHYPDFDKTESVRAAVVEQIWEPELLTDLVDRTAYAIAHKIGGLDWNLFLAAVKKAKKAREIWRNSDGVYGREHLWQTINYSIRGYFMSGGWHYPSVNIANGHEPRPAEKRPKTPSTVDRVVTVENKKRTQDILRGNTPFAKHIASLSNLTKLLAEAD